MDMVAPLKLSQEVSSWATGIKSERVQLATTITFVYVKIYFHFRKLDPSHVLVT